MSVPTYDQFIEPILRYLVNLMMDHEVGVTSRLLKLPKLDNDYFYET